MERAVTYSPTFIARGIWGYFWGNLMLEYFASTPPPERYLEETLAVWVDGRAQSIEQFTQLMALATQLPPELVAVGADETPWRAGTELSEDAIRREVALSFSGRPNVEWEDLSKEPHVANALRRLPIGVAGEVVSGIFAFGDRDMSIATPLREMFGALARGAPACSAEHLTRAPERWFLEEAPEVLKLEGNGPGYDEWLRGQLEYSR